MTISCHYEGRRGLLRVLFHSVLSVWQIVFGEAIWLRHDGKVRTPDTGWTTVVLRFRRWGSYLKKCGETRFLPL